MGIDLQRGPPALMELLHQHVPDPGGVHADEGDVPPDARVRQAGAPVPAEHAVGFAQAGEALHGVGGPVRRIGGVALPDEFRGRGEMDGDVVLPLPEEVLHVKLPDAVHVVRPSGLRAVDINRRQGVQPLAAQQDRAAVQQLPVHPEGAAVMEIIFHQLQGLGLIVPVEGVGDASRRQQVVINRAGHLGGPRRKGAARNVQSPRAVQR